MASRDGPPAKNGTSPPSPSVDSSYSTSTALQGNFTPQDSCNDLALIQTPPSLSPAPVIPGQDGTQHPVYLEEGVDGLALVSSSGSDGLQAGSSSSLFEEQRSDHMEDVPSQLEPLQPQQPSSHPCSQSQETLMADYDLSEGHIPRSNGATAGTSALPSMQAWNPATLLNPKGKGTEPPRSSSPGSGPMFGQNPQPSPQVFQFSSASDNDTGNGFANEPNGENRDPVQYSVYGNSSPSNPHTNGLSRQSTSTLAYSQPQQITNGRPVPTSNGMGTMIERMNGVQDRSTVPMAKRQKISDDDGDERPKYGSTSGSSGLLSSYVKEKQLADQSMAGSQVARKIPVLDLTGGTCSQLVEPKETVVLTFEKMTMIRSLS